MENRFLRFLVLLLQMLVTGICLATCVYGIVVTVNVLDGYNYIATVIRVSFILLLTISYYKTYVSSYNPGNLFIMLCLLFLTFSELRILPYFSSLTGLVILPPNFSVRLQLFSQYMAVFSLIGYALFYQNNEQNSTTRFYSLSLIGLLFLALTIPAPQNIHGVWRITIPFVILASLMSILLIAFLIIMFSDSSAVAVLRLSGMLLIASGNFVTTVFESFICAVIGTALFVIGSVIVMVVTLRNYVIL